MLGDPTLKVGVTITQGSSRAKISHAFYSLVPHINSDHIGLIPTGIRFVHEVNNITVMQAKSRIAYTNSLEVWLRIITLLQIR